MSAVWPVWTATARLVWGRLASLVALNVLWLVCSLPLVTAGAATLAAYWWAARVVRDGNDGDLGLFFLALRRFFGRGLILALAVAAFVLVAAVNVGAASRALPPLPAALVVVLWGYALVLALSALPYLLEGLVVDEHAWRDALARAAWQVAANPLYSHANALLVLAVFWLGARFHTLTPVVLVSLALALFAVAAERVPRRPRGEAA